jgi:hypothetical protein
VTGDTLCRFLNLTVFNPVITLPLIFLARFNVQGITLANQYDSIFSYLKALALLGLMRTANSWLNNVAMNNWTSDTYVWSREIVVVTGGSDGIGKLVVLLLAEKGIKVAVLDVQELTYEGLTKWLPDI